jgi:DNA ligase (NAD+)
MGDRERMEELRQQVAEANHRYYALDQPTLSDAEYDRLFRELARLEEAHPEWARDDSPTRRVSGAPVDGFAPVAHAIPMLSLGNSISAAEVEAFDARLARLLGSPGPLEYTAEPKYDGIAVELRYERGRLAVGSTRGDGQTGEDITHTLRRVRSIPLALRGAAPERLDVRGEVFMPLAEFARVNRELLERGEEPFANPRNCTAGTLRQLDSGAAAERRLEMFAYGVGLGAEELGATRFSAQRERLRELGLRIDRRFRVCTGIAEAIAFHAELEALREKLPYEVDGSVIKLDDLALRLRAGELARSPRWATAFKFPPRQETTRVREIRAYVGRTGALTPVAVLEPVHIGGVTVAHASLHNQDEIERLDVREGDTVFVERAGDVIPKIVKVVKELRPDGTQPWHLPANCPVCGSGVVRGEGEVAQRCPNLACPAQVKERLRHFASRGALDIEGLGEKLVDQLVERGLAQRPPDLFRLDRETLSGLERMAERSAQNAIDALERAKDVPAGRFLYALGIRHVGERVAELLAQAFPDLDRLAAASAEELEAVDEIGPTIARAVREYLDDPANRAEFAELRELLRIRRPAPRAPAGSGPLAGKSFVITGKLSVPRGDLEQRIEAAGGRVRPSVTSRTDYLVCGAKPGSKRDKAEALGVAVLDEAGLEALLSGAEAANPPAAH